MAASGRDISPYKRERLVANWSLCARSSADKTHPSESKDFQWIPIRQLMPAAAALRELNQWSIDDSARRFDAQDWWYRLRFDAPVLAQSGRTILGFDGLATVAQVWLNGQELLNSVNMFIHHECDVTHALKETGNELLICFYSLDAQLTVRRARPRWRSPMIENQQLRWFRTTLLGRTPGWSPPAAVVGPWKDIWLERRHQLDVKNWSLTATVQGTTGVVSCSLHAKTMTDKKIKSVQLHLLGPQRCEDQRLTGLMVRSPEVDTDSWTGEFLIKNIELWWPHTHGEPVLYRAWLKICTVGLEEQEEDVIVEMGNVGFRTILLNTDKGDFSVSVNGVAVFCRGACWTPLDPVTLRSCAEDYYAAVVQAREAGMNMLRVAGTMVYEDDHFFNACDQLGVMVWQDLMFANMDYPDQDAAFLTSVSVEVRQQLQRIQSRACLALLCGNSEVEQQAAMWGAPRPLWRSQLFDETFARLSMEFIPHTPYWPSSTHGGSFPHQANEGTTSYYGVGAYLGPVSDVRRSGLKFASECLAFANVPASSTIERMPGGLATRVHHPNWKARSPRDLGAGWDFDDVRDHYVGSLFKIDPQKLRYANHDQYLTLSRITTGEVMASSFLEWRHPASSCRGAIVLFLRDLWAGAGWGLIDNSGIPKSCYYYLKRALQPLTVFLSDEGINGLFIHLINEQPASKYIELEVTIWRDGDVLIATGKKEMEMFAHSSQNFACLDLFEHFMDLSYAYRFGPLPYDAIIVKLLDKQGLQLAQAFHFSGGLSTHPEGDLGLSASASKLNAKTALLTVRTKRLAQCVHVDIPGFQADDDYFHLAPHTETQITLRGNGSRLSLGTVHALNSTKTVRIEQTE